MVRDRAWGAVVLTKAVAVGERVRVSQPVYGDPDGFGVYGVLQQCDDGLASAIAILDQRSAPVECWPRRVWQARSSQRGQCS